MEHQENIFLSEYEEDLREIYYLSIKDKTVGKPSSEDIIDLLPQISIALSKDFEDAEKYFRFNNDLVPMEINMK